ncbi:unnamed protein product [Schistosoma rodhaini]|uniref:Reverse transcriptase domain-containing protein n=1 Tax=Schistosoma rodhaini TaxID=6188 RepID=A0AA85EUD4_9TREM|nr:unnamed protein product [Schistosoma rodhaini]
MRCLEVWTGGPYRTFLDIMVYHRKSSTSPEIHTPQSRKWRTDHRYTQSEDWSQTRLLTLSVSLSSYGNWIMKTSTFEVKYGILWTVWMQLDDLNFADDLALLSHTHEQMKVKTVSVPEASA